jgi:uncharacterized DUF497 family protein
MEERKIGVREAGGGGLSVLERRGYRLFSGVVTKNLGDCGSGRFGGADPIPTRYVYVAWDTMYIRMAVRVEWDENKNRANIAKHGIEFAAVVPVFDDPLSLTIPDRVADGEQRYRTIGAALDGVVLVAHTLREVSGGDELIRIISARYATSSERKAYEEGEY